MDFQMLDQYVHEVCQETKCFIGDRGEWIVYLDGVIYAKIIPENALQKQKTKSLSGAPNPAGIRKCAPSLKPKK